MNDLRQSDTCQGFSILLSQRAGQGDRSHGAGQGKRGQNHSLAGTGKVDNPSTHQFIELQRRVGINHRIAVHLVFKGVLVQTLSHSQNLQGICNCLAAPRVNKGRLIRQSDDRACAVQMADVGRQVLWFYHGRCQVQYIVGLCQAQKITESLVGACSSATLKIRVMRWPANRGKYQVIAADFKPTLWCPAMHGEGFGTLIYCLEHHVWIETHHEGIDIYLCAGRCVKLTGLGAQHLDTFISQQGK